MTNTRILHMRSSYWLITCALACWGAACKPPADGQSVPAYDDIQRIFDQSCGGLACHSGTADQPPASIDLSPGASYDQLVGQASTANPSMQRVTPGSPEASYLICVVDPACTALASAPMPPTGVLLSPHSVEAIRRWIAAGAVPGSGLDAGTAGDDMTAPVFGGISSAVATGETTAVLGWSPAVDVTPPSRLTYRVYSATSPGAQNFDVPVATVIGVNTVEITNLLAGTPYYFIARAVDEAGNVDANTVERVIATLDSTPPNFAGAQAAVPAGPGAITVSWNAATDLVSATPAIRYRVYLAPTSGGQNFAAPALTTAPGAVSATISGLPTSTPYYVVVRAVDEAGNEDANTVERTAAPPDTIAPSFGGCATATAGPQSVTLSWTAATDSVTASSQIVYLIYQSSSAGGESFAAPTYVTPAGATSFAVGGLSANTTYYFVVRARDGAGNIDTNTIERSATTPATIDTVPPTFAGAGSATPNGATSITLAWTAATDNVTAASNLVYLVYQATSSGGQTYASPSYTTLAGATSFAVTGLAPATPYYFVVRARDQAGNVDTNVVQVTASTGADTTPPTFAGASSATATGATSISLAWTAATDNATASSAIVYLVYQASASGGQTFGSPTYTTTPGATSFSVTGLSAATTYYFVVRARDGAGNVDTNTTERSVTTTSDTTAPVFAGATTATAASASSISLTWSAATDNSTASSQIVYLVYQASVSGGENFSSPSYTTAPGATSFTVTGLAASSAYFFVVRAKDLSGNIDGNTVQVSATTLPDTTPPTFAGLASATAATPSSIALTWSAASDDVTTSSGIVYLVYQATAPGGQTFGSPTLTTAPGETTATVTSLTPSTTYYFVVRAKDVAGNIDSNTTERSATTPAPPAPTVSFASNVQPIFTANCAVMGCHTGVAPAQGLNLSSGKAYAALVKVLSTECTSNYRVSPFAANVSYLVWKLQGSGPCFVGTQMPKGAAPLSSAQQATIATWINEGALNN